MPLADYVYTHRGALCNSITKASLPADSTEEALAAGFFLAGQREAALHSLLTRPPTAAHFDVIPTWACNLRCGHCCVLHKLDNETPEVADPDAVDRFVRRYLARHPQVTRVTVHLVGGEPLLEPELCLRVLAAARALPAAVTTSCVTNLVDLAGAARQVALGVDRLIVSVDGNKPEHNRQRHAYRATFDPYERTLTNLKSLLADGLDPCRAEVQAAVRAGEASPERRRSFYETFLRLGFPAAQIRYGTACPTVVAPRPSADYLEALRRVELRPRPCCKFRLMGNFTIQGRRVSTGYYDAEHCVVGDVDDPIEDVEARFARTIFARMPALADPRCRSCPALGFCWGGCDLTGEVLVRGRPSAFCDRDGMIAEVRRRAAAGTLPGVS